MGLGKSGDAASFTAMFDPRARQPIAVAIPSSGVFVLESHHARAFRMEPVRHDFLKLVQPFAGAGWLVRGAVRVPLRPGDVVIVPAGERHHLEDDGARPLSLYALCVAPRALPSGSRAGLDAYRHFPTPGWGGEFRTLIRHLLEHLPDTAVPAETIAFPPLAGKPLKESFRGVVKPIPSVD